jgi:enoyl-[acyl-carrier protein] reductase/trans-2-enoyl-CoA reductase (NAD+)
MRDDIQEKTKMLWEKATTENLPASGDLPGYREDFLNLFGFGFDRFDYLIDTNVMIQVPSI